MFFSSAWKKMPSFAYTYLTWQVSADRNKVTGAIWWQLKSKNKNKKLRLYLFNATK